MPMSSRLQNLPDRHLSKALYPAGGKKIYAWSHMVGSPLKQMVHLQLIPSNKKYGLIHEPHDCTTYFLQS